jgi:carboxyl-terminal processing protease
MIRKTIIFSGILVLFFINSTKGQFFIDKEIFKFGQVLELIERYYVDSVNKSKLIEDAIVDVLKELDPHSTFIPKEKVRDVNDQLEGDFEGVGIMFNILNDTIYVISPISGGPSEKVGVQAGDRIVEVEGENVAGVGITNKGVRDRLLGKKGTKVEVGIIRKGVDRLLHFIITRDKIPIHSLDASYMVDDKIGYIRLNRFSRTTAQEFKKSLTQLKQQGMERLILDLTGNAGGYLEIAAKLSDHFLDASKLIVYTKGLNSQRFEYKATRLGDFENGMVAVMIDEGSASASEIVSGAIQDWDRGLVIGRRSFGKGLVQRQFNLQDSSMVRLTIAEYYTPTGRLIQKPYKKGVNKYRKEIMERYEHGELTNKDSISFPDSLKYKTLVNKRVVYGGGGIMPDIFVPIDTSHVTDYLRDLMRQSLLYKFVLNYVDDNRKHLNSNYPDFATFKAQFDVDNYDIVSKLIKFAENNDLKTNENELETSTDRIKMLLKAYIARDIWNMNEFYQIYNQQNNIYIKAKQILQSPDKYQKTIKGAKK